MTGQALSETESETQEELQFWESEIRKLWDVSNKRNKSWIEENQQQLTAHGNRLDEMTSTLDALKATTSQHEELLGSQQEIISRLASLDERVGEVTSRQRELTDRVNSMAQNLNSLDSRLEKRVAANAQAVEAIDAWRLQVNGRLTRFQDRLDALAGGGAGDGGRTLTPEGAGTAGGAGQ